MRHDVARSTPAQIADGYPLRLLQHLLTHPGHRALGRPGVKPMSEDGGETERDPAAGDTQQGGNQQAPILLAEDVVDEDMQQPGPGEQDGGVPGGHRRRPRVVETPAAQIAPKPGGDLPVRDRSGRVHDCRRRGHCAHRVRRIIRSPDR